MHHIFSLREIVAAVLHSGSKSVSSTNRFLYSCLLVNRLFSDEAARILWGVCETNRWGCHHRMTPLKYLSAIAATDPARGQYYASLIQSVEVSEWDWIEGPYLPLQELQFTRLRELIIQTSGYFANSALSKGQSWRIQLIDKAPRLSSLDLTVYPYSLPEEDLIGLIKISPVLSKLQLWSDNEGMYMSSKLFGALMTLPSLSSLDCLHITSDTLKGHSPTARFPKLEHLYVEQTLESVSALVPFIPFVSELNILSSQKYITKTNEEEELSTIAASLAHLSRLTRLQFGPSGDYLFSGSDLITLATACPGLRDIKVELEGEYDLEDRHIEEFAHLLPRLEKASMISHQNCRLTHKSILSFGRHCRQITNISLTAVLAINHVLDNLRSVGDVSFLHLEVLDVCAPEYEIEIEDRTVYVDGFTIMKNLGPKMRSLRLHAMTWTRTQD